VFSVGRPPACEAFGYLLDDHGSCSYLDAHQTGSAEKICLCSHFSRGACYTCGHNVIRLKETARKSFDGLFELPSAEEVFLDYRFNTSAAAPRRLVA
jgi:nitronate monooxygenase